MTDHLYQVLDRYKRPELWAAAFTEPLTTLITIGDEDCVRLAECLAARIPARMHPGIACYVLCGTLPGGFLQACICNDLRGAAVKADLDNTPILAAYVRMMVNCWPGQSWGSERAMREWVAMGGLHGEYTSPHQARKA